MSFYIGNDSLLFTLSVLFYYIIVKFNPQKSLLTIFLLGLLAGTIFLTKYNGIILVVSFAIYVFVTSEELRKRFFKVFVFLFGFFVVSTPWFLRNYTKYEKVIPLKWQKGFKGDRVSFLSFRYLSLVKEPYEYKDYKTFFDPLKKPRKCDSSFFTRLYSTFFYDSLLYLKQAPMFIPSVLYATGIVFFIVIFIGMFSFFKIKKKQVFFDVISVVAGFLTLLAFNLKYPSIKLVHAKSIFLLPCIVSMFSLFDAGTRQIKNFKPFVKNVLYFLQGVLLIFMILYDLFQVYINGFD